MVLPIGGRIKKVCNLLIEDKKQLVDYLSEILPGQTLTKDRNTVEITYYGLEELYGRDFSELAMKNGVNAMFVKDEKTGIYQKNEYYRDLTQKVGKNVRDIFGEQVWVEILLNEANLLIEKGHKVICDDVRLEIEYDLFKENNYSLIRLDVDPEVQKKRILELYKTYNENALLHHTEIALDNHEFEYRFDTTFETVEETFEKVKKVFAA
jgi:hypothetical protein